MDSNEPPGTGFRLLPDESLTLRDVPLNDFPAHAWEPMGQTPDGRWRLRLRPGFLPPSLSDLTPAEPQDGGQVELQLTSSQMLEWEQRWSTRSETEATVLADLADARRTRIEAAAAVELAARGLRNGDSDAKPSIADVQASIQRLRDAGRISEKTAEPTRKAVAHDLSVSEGWLKAFIHKQGFRWPSRGRP